MVWELQPTKVGAVYMRNCLHEKLLFATLTLYQPVTHICVMSSHKPIIIYMGVLILGVNTLYRLFCFIKLFPMVGKGLISPK